MAKNRISGLTDKGVEESIFINCDKADAIEGFQKTDKVFKLLHDKGIIGRVWELYVNQILAANPDADPEEVAKRYPSFISGFHSALGTLVYNRMHDIDIIKLCL